MNSIGAVIVACFAVLWVAAGASNFGRLWFIALLATSILISAANIVAATHVPFGRHSEGFDGKVYGIVVTIEFVAILIAAVWIKGVGAKQYLMPVIAIIVGLHFFGMMSALHSNEFWLVGGAMALLPVLTILILPQTVWTPVVGIGCALILWLSTLGAFF